MSPYSKVFPDGIAYPVIGKGTSTVSVASSSALTSALDTASAGQKITLANWVLLRFVHHHREERNRLLGHFHRVLYQWWRIVRLRLAADHQGLRSTSTSKGLLFGTDSAIEAINIRGTSKNVRITRCTMGPSAAAVNSSSSGQYIYISDSAEFIRIDHNLFRNKGTAGNYIKVYGNDSAGQVNKHILIDHNIFSGCKPEMSNGKEPIRLGVSTMSKSMSYSVIERNYFTDNLCRAGAGFR